MTSSDWSVSVNTWVAAPGDDTRRLEEALVRCQGEYLKYRVFSRKVRMVCQEQLTNFTISFLNETPSFL